ncbi:aminoglycoside phosphotransferase family protein [Streptomyces cavernicola]|uniref:Aminoglycoside phosphotransferase family protein n=1 Tax=Streptomyces cavernicola TaxID=3043613 RepID=A0ABT6SG83_9ACTN|nr:aminoglycoside phosphotransferase family protein [Streptomyces sp. B-S-A6]MDI3407221.1 aminoglycoside phosphotransferase family protein [Streptomyces sp. B-S-A6]
MSFEPPQRLVRALGEATYEDPTAVRAWLAELPVLLERAVERLELTVERVLVPGGRSSLVALVRRADGTPATLKLAAPGSRPEAEAAALACWDGWGACRLLQGPVAGDGALLLERLQPEVSLRSLPETKALLEAAGTVRRLWVEPPAGQVFETVAERSARLASAVRPADEAMRPLVDAALAARDELVAAEAELLLLHGDFRQGKVLAGERTPWLAVGPHPLVGERAYDLAGLVLDRLDDLVAASAGAATGRRRVSKLADSLEVDQERVRSWTLFRAVTSGTAALHAGRRPQAEVLLEFASWL